MKLLPLAVIYRNSVCRNHIVEILGNNIKITPFENECEATRFLSVVIIVANQNAITMLNKLPAMGEWYMNIDNVVQFMAQHNLFEINEEEPTLICADSSKYAILRV